jgi:hypothetical protein
MLNISLLVIPLLPLLEPLSVDTQIRIQASPVGTLADMLLSDGRS